MAQENRERNWQEVFSRMIDAGLTPTEIGYLVGVSAQAVHLYKRGKNVPSRSVQMLVERNPQLRRFLTA